MFSAVNEPVTASVKINKEFDNVGLLANQWTMTFNPDPPKQVQEIFFSRNIKNISSVPIIS